MTWQHWLREEWNKPDRSDNYQMQTAYEIRRAFTDKPGDPNELRIKFNFQENKKKQKEEWHPFPPLTKETIAKVQTAIAKARLMKIAGVNNAREARERKHINGRELKVEEL